MDMTKELSIKIIHTKFRFNGRLIQRKVTNKIILHHRAGDGDVNSIHQSHLARGWIGIGYHYYIRRDGSIYEGRNNLYIGAHCRGQNSCSLGICLEGDLTKKRPTDRQVKAAQNLVRYLRNLYQSPFLPVYNHRDFDSTICPGMDLAKVIKEGL